MSESLILHKEVNEQIDRLEVAALANLPAIDLPLIHRFTPGLYAREIFMPKGALVTSKIHKTEHPFVILEGRVSVYNTETGEVIHYEAPFVGVTKPGTRRVLYMHEDTRWITFHPLAEGESNEADLPKIEERIIERRELANGKTAFDHWRERLLEQPEELPEQLDYWGAP